MSPDIAKCPLGEQKLSLVENQCLWNSFPFIWAPWSSYEDVKMLVTQLCPTLWDPMDCSLPDSSVHGISQARILEWVAIFLLQGIFPTQGSNQRLLLWEVSSLPLSQMGSKFVHISSSWLLITDLYLVVQTCRSRVLIVLLMDTRASCFLDIMEKSYCQHLCV